MLNEGAGARRLRLDAPLTVRGAPANRDALLAGFAESSALELEFSADEADCAGVQLIESTRRYAQISGKQLRLASPASGALKRVLEGGGFLAAAGPEDRQFWLHEGVAQ
jgi:hypothetical protein